MNGKALVITGNRFGNIWCNYNTREEPRLICDMFRRVHNENIIAIIWLNK